MKDELSLLQRFGESLAQRDGGWFCHYCHIPIERRPFVGKPKDDCSNGFGTATIDHKNPRSAGGEDTPDNMVLACINCNREKGIQNYERYYRWTVKRRLRRFGKRGIGLNLRV